jgi:hypothetical protein
LDEFASFDGTLIEEPEQEIEEGVVEPATVTPAEEV